MFQIYVAGTRQFSPVPTKCFELTVGSELFRRHKERVSYNRKVSEHSNGPRGVGVKSK